MIVGNHYPGDDNRILKEVQHELYGTVVARLFESAKAAMMQADAILGADLLITEKLRGVRTFDHRVLQDAHDILAAAYRHQHDDGGQLQFGEDAGKQRLRYMRSWSNWMDEELAELVRFPQFVRSTVECVVFSNAEMGYMTEDRLRDLLLTWCSADDWSTASTQ